MSNEEVNLPVKKQRVGLENQLFVWNEWDDNGNMMLLFYNVELLIQIGEFPKGHKFPVAFFNGDESTVSFTDENDVEHTYPMLLNIGKKIEKENDA